METTQFEPMSVGRIFDRAFAIYRNSFLRFITIVAIIEVPLALFSAVSGSWLAVRTPVRRPTALGQAARRQAPYVAPRQSVSRDRKPPLFGCLGTAFRVLLPIVSVMLCQAALIKSVSETYLGNEITLGQTYGYILPKALTLVLATIFTTLVTWLGFLLLVVPGVIFGLWFFLTVPALVVENHSATGGMSRSKALVAGNLGKVFAVGLVSVLIAYIVALPLNRLGGLAAKTLFGDNLPLRVFFIRSAATLGQILVTPIGAAASILLYYDLRIRKEGFDLQMLARSMGSEQGESRAV